MRGFTVCQRCGESIRIGAFKHHMASHGPEKKKKQSNGHAPAALAFESLPGDPVGKVRWALDMLSRGSGRLEADLLRERANLTAKVEEIDRQLAILKSLNPPVPPSEQQQKIVEAFTRKDECE